MGRLGLGVALAVWVAACDASAPVSFDIASVVGVYTGTRTVDVLGAEPEVAPATVTISADAPSRTISFAVGVRGESAIVLPGTYTEAGVISAGNALGSAGLSVEFVVDPTGTLRGAYAVVGPDSLGTPVTGIVEGRLVPGQFLLTLVEPEAGGVRTEVRASRSSAPATRRRRGPRGATGRRASRAGRRATP
ncbi:hypothetical protein [Rubrivirga sp.]|uniref:hypothetical protein n=1 Tax=Rubrivirga sp. TaxID=1885344 RepID=UPI003B51BF0E